MVFGSNAESGGKKKCCEGMYFDLDSLSYVLFHESVATLPNYKIGLYLNDDAVALVSIAIHSTYNMLPRMEYVKTWLQLLGSQTIE